MTISRYQIPFAPDDGGGNGGGGSDTQGGDGGQQQQQQPWYAPHKFDNDTVAYIEERKFPDLQTMVRSGIEGSRLARDRNVFERPKDVKNLKDWKHWGDLGWVDKYDDYQLKAPEGLAETELMEPGMAEVVRKAAHDARVPLPAMQDVFSAASQHLAKTVRDLEAEGARRADEDKKALAAALEKEWGPQAATKTELAKRAARAVAGDNRAALDALERALAGADGKGGDVQLLRLFAGLGERMGEALFVDGAGSAGGGPQTIASIDAELRRLEGDPNWMKVFRDARHPQHADYAAQRQRLIDQKAKLIDRAAQGGR